MSQAVCGIFGELSPALSASVRSEWAPLAHAALRHRGPDASGVFSDERCLLGHTRLKIIDLSDSAAQPMASPAGRSVVTFNGEIYNYPELRRTMGDVRFRSNGDTEVLLRLLEAEGPGAVSKLLGMFAFAFYRPAERELWLVRDRVGKKPLFYTRTRDGGIRFASELSALLADPALERRTTVDRIAEYLQAGYINAPRTPFLGVEAVPPGSILTARIVGDRVETRLSSYWSLPTSPGEPATSEEAWLEEFRATLDDAVKIRLRSDVPVGAFLSGGVDSSVTSLLACRAVGGGLRTLTIDSSDAVSEAGYGEQVARKIGSNHLTVPIPRLETRDLDDTVGYYPELLGDASLLSALTACRAIRQHVTVGLTGDGGDELLCGYVRYFESMRIAEQVKRVPRPLRQGLGALAKAVPSWLGGAGRLFSRSDGVDNAFLSLVQMYPAHRAPPFLRQAASPSQPIQDALERYRALPPSLRMMSADYDTYIPGDTNVTLDRASMSVALELRCPFLDHRLFELVRRARFEWLLDGERGKRPLRKLFASELPEPVFTRAKRGFSVPIDRWMDEMPLEELLLAPGDPMHEVVDATSIRLLIMAYRRRLNRSAARLWSLQVLSRWLRHWKVTVSA